MTNEQKFRTADERFEACVEFLKNHKEYDEVPFIKAVFRWLALEAEEETENCPFCGGEMVGRFNSFGPSIWSGQCARGYEPKDKVVGVWTGECEFCGKRKPLTSLCNDWRKKGADNASKYNR